MLISDVFLAPTTIDNVHQSCFRSHQALILVKEMLERKTPKDVVLEVINDVLSAPNMQRVQTARSETTHITDAARYFGRISIGADFDRDAYLSPGLTGRFPTSTEVRFNTNPSRNL